jgi:ankyrin repeat protein
MIKEPVPFDQLIEAIRVGNRQRVVALLDAGVDVNATNEGGSTPLIMAAYYDQAGIARLLVERGAELNRKNDEGETAAFMAATRSEKVAVLSYLLQQGAEAGSNKAGNTALCKAASRDHHAIVGVLIRSGVDVNEISAVGNRTALIAAAKEWSAGSITFLLRAGADLEAVDDTGRTALQTAEDEGFDDGVRLLRDEAESRRMKAEQQAAAELAAARNKTQQRQQRLRKLAPRITIGAGP